MVRWKGSAAGSVAFCLPGLMLLVTVGTGLGLEGGLTVSGYDHITSPKRVAMIFSGLVGEGPIPWRIPSYEEETGPLPRSAEGEAAGGRGEDPRCHLRFYGVALEEHLRPSPKSGLATLFYEPVPESALRNFSASLQTPCYYLTNGNTYTDEGDKPKTLSVVVVCPIHVLSFCAFLPGNSFSFTMSFHRNSSDPPLVSYFTSNLTTAASTLPGLQVEEPRDAVCTVQVYENEVSGVKLLSWSLYHLSLSYIVLIYDRYAMHAPILAPLLSEERYRGRLFYFPYTVFQIWNPAMYNSLQRQKQVFCDYISMLIGSPRGQGSAYKFYTGHQKKHSQNHQAKVIPRFAFSPLIILSPSWRIRITKTLTSRRPMTSPN